MQIVHTYTRMYIHMHIYSSPVGHRRAEIKSKMKMVMSPPAIGIWCSSEWSMQIKHDNKLMCVCESGTCVCCVCVCCSTVFILNSSIEFLQQPAVIRKSKPEQANLLSASTMVWMYQRICLKLFAFSDKVSIKSHEAADFYGFVPTVCRLCENLDLRDYNS